MKSIPSTRHLNLGTVTLMSVEKSGEGLLIFFFNVCEVDQQFTLTF